MVNLRTAFSAIARTSRIISTRTLSRQPGHGPDDHCGGRKVEKTFAVHSEIPVSGALNTRM